jgi:adenylate cyclase
MGAPSIYFFQRFRFDQRGLFRRDLSGAFVPVEIGSRALDVLKILVERAGDIVPRDEIMVAVWPRTAVEGSNLPVQIAALRRVLDDEQAQGSCIQTIPGRGYRFVAQLMPAPPALSASRLSILVLPFANLSNEVEQEYFADGITEDLTTDLSRIEGMVIISRNAAFTYKDKRVDVKQIGRELGVHYIIEGSVRRFGPRIRINSQLIETERGTHLWAERFDGEADDLFGLQDEITSRIAIALDVELVSAETARFPNRFDAFDLILRGRAALAKRATRINYEEAIGLFEQAMELSKCSAEAQIWLAAALAARKLDNLADMPTTDIARAEELIGEALAILPRNGQARFARGQILRAQGRLNQAIGEYEAAIALNRNNVGAIYALGWCRFLTGSAEAAIPLVEQAIHLSPRDPLIATWYAWIGRVHLLQSRTDEAVAWLERARSANPDLPVVHAPLAAAYALRGEIERAAVELAAARRLAADDRFSSLSIFRSGRYFGVPSIRALYEKTYFVGLRKAGLPEN